MDRELLNRDLAFHTRTTVGLTVEFVDTRRSANKAGGVTLAGAEEERIVGELLGISTSRNLPKHSIVGGKLVHLKLDRVTGLDGERGGHKLEQAVVRTHLNHVLGSSSRLGGESKASDRQQYSREN